MRHAVRKHVCGTRPHLGLDEEQLEAEQVVARDELPRLAEFVQAEIARRQAEAIPDIRRDKDAWYAFWDEDDSGELDKEEVVRALLKTLALTGDPTRVQMMRSTVEAIWPVFDDDGSGTIDRQEFLKANDGLADTIIATMGAPL